MHTILSESLAKLQYTHTHDLFCTYLLVFCKGLRRDVDVNADCDWIESNLFALFATLLEFSSLIIRLFFIKII